MVAFFHLHGVTQRSGSTRHNGDFLHRSGMALHGSNKCMSDFMVSNNFLFLIGKNGIFLLIASDDHLNAFFQILLGYKGTSIADRPESRLIEDVGELRSGSSGCHACYLFKINGIFK